MAFLFQFKNTAFLWLLILSSCGNQGKKANPADEMSYLKTPEEALKTIRVGANSVAAYMPILEGKKIAVVANQTSVIFKDGIRNKKLEMGDSESGRRPYTHIVDSLISLEVDIVKVFAPEHGFRGEADAGEHVTDGMDIKTGLPIISLYGKNRKPSQEQMEDLNLVLFDIQDVGVRFYTYIATLQLVMEACAEKGLPIVVLDRPNPNGHYVDGPVMEKEHTGFLGMTTIPLVYGMTIGEYARMINEERWLNGGKKVDLTVIPLENYTHNASYSLPIRPSPNLPNDTAINLYPSMGLFEGTNINAGRGTEDQFQRYGAPFLDSTQYDFKYTPLPNFGSKAPKHQGSVCFGKNLSKIPKMSRVSLEWIMDAYVNATDKKEVFNTSGFTKHAGTEKLQKQLEAGLSEEEIRKTWEAGLESFKKIREKYLMYP